MHGESDGVPGRCLVRAMRGVGRGLGASVRKLLSRYLFFSFPTLGSVRPHSIPLRIPSGSCSLRVVAIAPPNRSPRNAYPDSRSLRSYRHHHRPRHRSRLGGLTVAKTLPKSLHTIGESPRDPRKGPAMKPRKPTGYVIYRGPSQLDGAPIVAIALTGSSNRKTGNMVQTYILRADVAPLAALKNGADASVCGDCKHRPANGGACYVQVERGPTVVFKTWTAGKYPYAGPVQNSGYYGLDPYEDVRALGDGRMVRLGTYGDPAAVPSEVWQALTARAAGWTGYTHQWQNENLDSAHRAAVASLCMASVDNPREAEQARAHGLRYFRIRRADESLRPLEFVCPASEEAGKRKTCATCGACSGTRDNGRGGSAVIIVHGSKARRYTAQRAA